MSCTRRGTCAAVLCFRVSAVPTSKPRSSKIAANIYVETRIARRTGASRRRVRGPRARRVGVEALASRRVRVPVAWCVERAAARAASPSAGAPRRRGRFSSRHPKTPQNGISRVSHTLHHTCHKARSTDTQKVYVSHTTSPPARAAAHWTAWCLSTQPPVSRALALASPCHARS